MVDYKWVKWKAFQTKFWGIMKKGYFDNLVLRVSYPILCMSFAPLHPTSLSSQIFQEISMIKEFFLLQEFIHFGKSRRPNFFLLEDRFR